MPACPFCSEEPHSELALVNHVLESHLESDVCGRRLYITQGRSAIQCWCGRSFFFLAEPFNWRCHLMDRGGMEAHILEIALLGRGHSHV